MKCPGAFKVMARTWDSETTELFPLDSEDTGVKCYESDKVTCHVYSNGTLKHFDVRCKPQQPPANGAAAVIAAAGLQALALATVLALVL